MNSNASYDNCSHLLMEIKSMAGEKKQKTAFLAPFCSIVHTVPMRHSILYLFIDLCYFMSLKERGIVFFISKNLITLVAC